MKKLVGIFFLCGFIFVVVYFNGNIKKHLPPIENNDTLKRSVKKTKLEEHFFSKLSDTWEIHRYSFPENGCEMMDSQVSINKSKLVLSVELNRKNAAKPYKGGEISSVFPFLYGQFSVRMKSKIAPGTVSSFFIMNQWQPENWEQKEIDIEFLGKNTKAVQFTVHHYKEDHKKHIFYEHTHILGFDSSDNFHEYSILWTKDSISWLIDGKWVYSEKRILIDEKMYIRLNHWAGDTTNKDFIKWLGRVEPCKLPSKVYYDYVKYVPLKKYDN